MHTKLCAACESIPLHDLLEKTYALWAKSGPASQSKDWTNWHSNLKGLIAASASCDLCDTILLALQADLRSQVDLCINNGDMPEEDGKEYSEGFLAVPRYWERYFKLELSYDSKGTQCGRAHAFLDISLKPTYYRSSEPADLHVSFRIVTSHGIVCKEPILLSLIADLPRAHPSASRIRPSSRRGPFL
jgi:hypothetical protein